MLLFILQQNIIFLINIYIYIYIHLYASETFRIQIDIIIIRYDLECEMVQFHPKVHIFKSETKLAEFLIKENVNLRVELSHLTLFGKLSDIYAH